MIRSIVMVSLLGSTLLFVLACSIPILGMYIFTAFVANSQRFFSIVALEVLVTLLMFLVTLNLSKRYPQLWILWLVSSSLVVSALGWVSSIGHLLSGGDKAAILFWAGLVGSAIPIINGVLLMVGRAQAVRR